MANLAALRAEIDRVDADLLSLMEQRLAVSRAIAAVKAREPDALMLRPDREERVITRLAELSARIPEVSIAAIWRELMSLNLQSQRRTDLVIHSPRHLAGVTARANARFGASAPVMYVETAEQALCKARHSHAVAIVEFDQQSKWWCALGSDTDLRIIDELRATGGRGSALAVGRVPDTHLPQGRRWQVMAEAELFIRLRRGEAACPIAASGSLRLCVIENIAQPVPAAA